MIYVYRHGSILSDKPKQNGLKSSVNMWFCTRYPIQCIVGIGGSSRLKCDRVTYARTTSWTLVRFSLSILFQRELEESFSHRRVLSIYPSSCSQFLKRGLLFAFKLLRICRNVVMQLQAPLTFLYKHMATYRASKSMCQNDFALIGTDGAGVDSDRYKWRKDFNLSRISYLFSKQHFFLIIILWKIKTFTNAIIRALAIKSKTNKEQWDIVLLLLHKFLCEF